MLQSQRSFVSENVLFFIYKFALHGQQFSYQTGKGNRLKPRQFSQDVPVWKDVITKLCYNQMFLVCRIKIVSKYSVLLWNSFYRIKQKYPETFQYCDYWPIPPTFAHMCVFCVLCSWAAQKYLAEKTKSQKLETSADRSIKETFVNQIVKSLCLCRAIKQLSIFIVFLYLPKKEKKWNSTHRI